MSNIISTLKRLPGMENTAPASNDTICDAEKKLNLKFADDYRKYLATFGTVCSDLIAVSGLGGKSFSDVVNLTTKCQSVNEQIPNNFYVIEDVGVDGLVIWQDASGVVYQSVPLREPEKIHDSLSDYLEYVIKG